MPAPLTPGQRADVDAANAILDEYEGDNKFMRDILGKRARFSSFELSARQAEVILKIADEEFRRQQESEEPF